jgi:hypothetical protein
VVKYDTEEAFGKLIAARKVVVVRSQDKIRRHP